MVIRRRVKTQYASPTGDLKKWKNTLKDEPCFLIGNGPSLRPYKDLSILNDFFTLGINQAFELIDPTILMWQDIEFWKDNNKRISKLEAIKYCRRTADPKRNFFNFKLKGGKFTLPHNPLELFGMGASGPLAFQLAHNLGCNPIVILGMDCCYRDGYTDFYGVNKYHNPRTLTNCTKGLNWIKSLEKLHNYNTTVYNCSDNDILGKKISIKNAIEVCENSRKIVGRDNLKQKILGRDDGKTP